MLPLHQQADIAIQHSGLKAMYPGGKRRNPRRG